MLPLPRMHWTSLYTGPPPRTEPQSPTHVQCPAPSTGPQPTEACMVGKRVVHILLECFLVYKADIKSFRKILAKTKLSPVEVELQTYGGKYFWRIFFENP